MARKKCAQFELVPKGKFHGPYRRTGVGSTCRASDGRFAKKKKCRR